ncbi:hypothetical protein BJY04DRAFT_176127 [Aspergillus karnatakaensis]|uniref:uncharacterized protein n=1 Tax=Aspergillus karnatakaensis TaxID=1810916 RepID=UPI003CCCF485
MATSMTMGKTPISSHNQQRTRDAWHSPKTIVLVLVSTVSLFIFGYKSFHSNTGSQHLISGDSNHLLNVLDHDSAVSKHPCPLPTARYDILTGHAACYPSSGGIWMAELGPLELEYLGINRFESTERAPVQKDEDAFCHKLRIFGGSWYDPAVDGSDLSVAGQCHQLDEFEAVFSIVREVAYPEGKNAGGVWVLGVNKDMGRFPEGMAMVRNTLTMKERCTTLERLGATFCEEISGCEPLKDLVIEPFSWARGY